MMLKSTGLKLKCWFQGGRTHRFLFDFFFISLQFVDQHWLSEEGQQWTDNDFVTCISLVSNVPYLWARDIILYYAVYMHMMHTGRSEKHKHVLFYCRSASTLDYRYFLIMHDEWLDSLSICTLLLKVLMLWSRLTRRSKQRGCLAKPG